MKGQKLKPRPWSDNLTQNNARFGSDHIRMGAESELELVDAKASLFTASESTLPLFDRIHFRFTNAAMFSSSVLPSSRVVQSPACSRASLVHHQ